MKEYYFYDSDITLLTRTGAQATLFFAISSGCLGFAVNAYIAVTFGTGVAEATIIQWTIYYKIAACVAVLSFAYAAVLALSGFNQIEFLKSQTRHGTETYTPRARYKVALFLIGMLALVLFGAVLQARVFGGWF